MALDDLLAKEGGHCNLLGIIDPENCVMLLPDFSENMTAIIDKIADLSKTLNLKNLFLTKLVTGLMLHLEM